MPGSTKSSARRPRLPTSQMPSAPSAAAAATRLPSALRPRALMPSRCVASVPRSSSFRASRFHSPMVPSNAAADFSRDGPYEGSLLHVPQAYRAVVGGGRDAPAVGAHGHGDDGPGVSLQATQEEPVRSIPDAHGGVLRAGGQEPS